MLDNMNGLTILVLAVGGIGWIAVQQLITRRIPLRKLWTMSFAALVVAAINLKPEMLNNSSDLTALIIAVVTGGAIGLIQGWVNPVRFDTLTQEIVIPGSVTSLVIWIGLVVVRIVVKLALMNLDNLPLQSQTGITSLIVMFAASIIASRCCWFLKIQSQFTQLGQIY